MFAITFLLEWGRLSLSRKGQHGGAALSHIEVGEKAPSFKLPTNNQQTVELDQYRGKKNVVLLFYPLAWTPV